METKYIFVTGGVVSGLGKGITAASLGRLLKNRGYRITMQKLDPYINVDPGTMNPLEHGEVFVTDDGAETDLDLGHYERFIDENLTHNSSMTTGKIYLKVIEKEREGAFLGKTIQVIPHITNEIKDQIYSLEKDNIDIVITEIGGTVGDIESQPFLEAIRQVAVEKGQDNVLYIHVTLLPYISGSDEVKSKPTQHSVKELQSLGINPNILVCRADAEIDEKLKEKIALFCNVKKEDIIQNTTVDNLYAVPLNLEKEGLAKSVCKHLKLQNIEANNIAWKEMIENIKKIERNIKIAIVGKYVKLHDAYLSVTEALRHAGYANMVNVDIEYIDSENLSEQNCKQLLKNVNGILVPGGFGIRGTEGKIQAIKYARENNIPFLGICLGMQLATIEFARNVLNLIDANSLEFDELTKNPVICIMEEQKNIKQKGGTMRLGNYNCRLDKNSIAYKAYNKDVIIQRHRHRFEFNNNYKQQFEKEGVIFSGINPERNLVEIIEYPKHPFFVATQFHPEFKSRPNKPEPIFVKFVECINMYKS